MMHITNVTIRHVKMKLKHPFTTSFGTVQQKSFLMIEAQDKQGTIGWGESVAFDAPWYTEETTKTVWHMLEDFLIPLILHREISHPDEVSRIFSVIKRNQMAKAAMEGAIWDIYAKQTNQSLAAALGGQKDRIEVGISIGIQQSMQQLIEQIDSHLQSGFKRVKIKIKPGQDVDVLRTVRQHFPHVPLMADANSAYRLEDAHLLQQLDELNLLMIEQPLAADDIVDHAKLQQQIQTPICLDESICSLEDARKAIELGSCQVINVKIGRVGGLTVARDIHDYCQEKHIPVWCGGMLEAGIGRAHNIALTSLSNFILPGDTAGSSHYWEQDIIEPEVIVENGYIYVPQQIGIGFVPSEEILNRFTIAIKRYQ